MRSTCSRLLTLTAIIAVLASCLSDTNNDAGVPEWADTLFSDIENLTVIESDDRSAKFEFQGHASEMAQLIMARLDDGEDFVLHQRLAVSGETDEGSVHMVWTPTNPEESSGLGNGSWIVEATITRP